MTSKLTREWLQQTISDIQTRRDNGSVSWDDERENILQAFKLALAAMDSEPVAYADPQSFDNFKSNGGKNAACTKEWMWRDQSVGLIPLYRHAQEADCDDCAVEGLRDENVSFHRLPGESEYDRLNRQREWMKSKSKLAKVTAAVPDGLTERLIRLRAQTTLDGSYLGTEEWDSLACDAIKALNACRAAMLQAQSDDDGEPTDDERIMAIEGIHNCERCGDEGWVVGEMGITRCACGQDSPVCTCPSGDGSLRWPCPSHPGNSPVIPDRWIPVSERLPEADGNYWGWWSESKRQGPVWFIKSELQAQFQSHEITHWMPLPAAPQEVQGE